MGKSWWSTICFDYYGNDETSAHPPFGDGILDFDQIVPVLAKENAASGMTAGTHGSTYGGNPLGCSIGLKVMDIISNPNFLLDVNHKAKNFRAGLSELLNKNTSIFEEVRGKGLMLGLKCKVQNIDVVNAGYSPRIP